MREQRGGEVDFPALRLHLDDAADDEVADFGRVARAEGTDGEEFVGFEEGAGDGGEDLGGRGVGVGSVASVMRARVRLECVDGVGSLGGGTASIVGRRLRFRRV